MTAAAVQNQIEAWLGENLDSPDHFLVKVSVGLGKVQEAKVQVLIDSDSGITIDECAAYSRKLGGFLEENDLLEASYTLEVASPGLDFPLSGERQFRKNIGRLLVVDCVDGTRLEGKLETFGPPGICLLITEKGKGKKVQTREIMLPLDQIKKAKVTVSFK
jgi:ribosome maturation factor RimP